MPILVMLMLEASPLPLPHCRVNQLHFSLDALDQEFSPPLPDRVRKLPRPTGRIWIGPGY